jgi:hypothetical protein
VIGVDLNELVEHSGSGFVICELAAFGIINQEQFKPFLGALHGSKGQGW